MPLAGTFLSSSNIQVVVLTDPKTEGCSYTSKIPVYDSENQIFGRRCEKDHVNAIVLVLLTTGTLLY
jgi:hypothetical protein